MQTTSLLQPSGVPGGFIGRDCTLNGKPASVTAIGPHAMVRPKDRNKGSVEFSWDEIDRVMANGAAFCCN